MQPACRKAPAFVPSLLGLAVLLGSSLAAQAPAPQQLMPGDHAGDALGASVAAAGDVNADGVADLLVGAPQDGAGGRGYARVFSGKDGTLIARFLGAADGDLFGAAVAGAGDADHDGHADVLVGAPRTGSPGASATLFSGDTGLPLLVLPGSAAEADGFGAAVAGAGRIDADVDDDLLVGAPHAALDTGRAVVLAGAGGGTLFTFVGDKPGDLFGGAVAGAGDVNDDGHPDVVIGAGGGAYARVFSGADGSLLRDFHGPNDESTFGQVVAAAGDIDGDGFDDVAIGAPAIRRVDILSGKTGLLLRRFERDPEGFASSIALLGDLDADGKGDFAIGAPLDTLGDTGGGSVFLLSGDTGVTLFKFFPEPTGAQFGAAVAGPGDLDGDGRPEILVGAPHGGVSGDTGAASRFSGAFAGTILPYGLGCPSGFLITPRIDLLGDPQPNGALTLTISKGHPESFCDLLIGMEAVQLPLSTGCVLWVQPLISLQIPLPGLGFPGSGEAILEGRLPPDVPHGMVITMQAFVADSDTESGYTTTAAVKLTVL